jgi:RNA polymerase sigma-70 factor (ECF subfamily)
MSSQSTSSKATKLRLVRGASASDPNPTPEPAAVVGSGESVGALPDDSLVALAMGGDMRAAEVLYRRHAPFALNLATRIAGSTHDVEDVVHDAFLRAFDNLETLRNTKAFRGWLGSIVVHTMRSRLRRARMLRLFGLGRGGEAVDIDCVASDEASPAQRAELAQVYALLRTLPADDRIAWTLRFVEGHDLKAAADLADCSLATVKRRIRRAQRYIEMHFVGTHLVHDDEEPSDEDSSASQRKSQRSNEEAAS